MPLNQGSYFLHILREAHFKKDSKIIRERYEGLERDARSLPSSNRYQTVFKNLIEHVVKILKRNQIIVKEISDFYISDDWGNSKELILRRWFLSRPIVKDKVSQELDSSLNIPIFQIINDFENPSIDEIIDIELGTIDFPFVLHADSVYFGKLKKLAVEAIDGP